MDRFVDQRLKALQQKLGVKADGILGPATLTALERAVAGTEGTEAHGDFSMIVSQSGLEQLMRFEISTPQNYHRNLDHPIWPGGGSGITIGVGYDLGFNSPQQLQRDWSGRLTDHHVKLLRGVTGLKGAEARSALWRVRNVIVPFDAAQQVFYKSTLPRYARLTRRTYPQVHKLPADAQAMLLSLVYNRGSRLSGARRREMKAIKHKVVRQDLPGIADEMLAMQRLWNKTELPGLYRRRGAEADLVRKADRSYLWPELIYI